MSAAKGVLRSYHTPVSHDFFHKVPAFVVVSVSFLVHLSLMLAIPPFCPTSGVNTIKAILQILLLLGLVIFLIRSRFRAPDVPRMRMKEGEEEGAGAKDLSSSAK